MGMGAGFFAGISSNSACSSTAITATARSTFPWLS